MLAQLINTSTQTTIHLDALRLDGGTQPRDGLNTAYVTELAQSLQDGAAFPPIDVMHDGANYWLYDGYHRVAAHRQANILIIPATIHQGDQAAAQWRSYAANQTHGLRRTNDDKKRAILAALRHPNAAALSDRQIASHLGVDHKTIAVYREHLQSTGEIPSQTQRTGADGRTIETANIGVKPATLGRYTVEDLRVIVREYAQYTGLDPAPEGTPFWSKLTEFIKQRAETTKTYWSVSDLRQALDQVIRQNQRQLPEFTVPEMVDLIRTCAQDTGLEPSVTGAFWHEVNAAITAAAGGRRWSSDLLRASIIAVQPRPVAADARPLPAWVTAEPEPEPETDPWVSAWDFRQSEAFDNRVRRLAAAMQEWVLAWTDDKGRTWRDVADRNPQHANSPFRQALDGECRRRGLVMAGGALAAVIEEIFSNLAATDKRLLSDGDPIEMPDDLVDVWSLRVDGASVTPGVYLVDVVRNRSTETVALDDIDELFAQARRMDAALDAEQEPLTAADLHVMQPTPPISQSPTPPDPRHTQLNTWWLRLVTLRSELGDWAELTGRYTDTLGIVRELNKLIDITQAELALVEA